MHDACTHSMDLETMYSGSILVHVFASTLGERPSGVVGGMAKVTHNDKGEQALALVGGGVRQGGQLEAVVDALPYPLGAFHVFQEVAVLLHARDAKCVVHRPHLRMPQSAFRR